MWSLSLQNKKPSSLFQICMGGIQAHLVKDETQGRKEREKQKPAQEKGKKKKKEHWRQTLHCNYGEGAFIPSFLSAHLRTNARTYAQNAYIRKRPRVRTGHPENMSCPRCGMAVRFQNLLIFLLAREKREGESENVIRSDNGRPRSFLSFSRKDHRKRSPAAQKNKSVCVRWRKDVRKTSVRALTFVRRVLGPHVSSVRARDFYDRGAGG